MRFFNKRLWVLLLALVALRLPNLNRPVSKHHEFNTAVILINAESWQQAGGGMQFWFTPLMNYQGSSNRVLESGPHVDSSGNHIYLSFGAGWYLFPYAIFQVLQVKPTPLALQLLNLLIGLLTACLLYRLLWIITDSRKIALYGTALFALLPAPLWYMGNGYVTTAVMLPLVIGMFFLWHRFEKKAGSVTFMNCSWLLLAGVGLCYFDWLAVFLLTAIAMWSISKARSNARYLWVTATASISLCTGIYIVLWQFAGYLGWEQVIAYWQSRFIDRSADTSEFSFGAMLMMIVKNLISGYLPLFLIIVVVLLIKDVLKRRFLPGWPLWAFFAIIIYNGVFFNWSAQHEFAWMAFALIAAAGVNIYFLPMLTPKKLSVLIAVTIICSLIQYYIINLPGPVSIKGDRYDAQKQLGAWIRENIDTSTPIFSNAPNNKIAEYYAKRTINAAESAAFAKKHAIKYGLEKAVWLQIRDNQVERIVVFFPPDSR